MKRFRSGQINKESWESIAEMPSRPENPKLVLGVDGGATSTVCICMAVPFQASFCETPAILGRAVAGCSNHNSVGEEAAREALEKVLVGALKDANANRSAVKAVCLAVSGVDNDRDRDAMLAFLGDLFPSDVHFFVSNDSFAALASGTFGKLQGCVLIAGTGTIAYGFTEDGRQARASGGGPTFLDQGSGYAIASQGLGAILRGHDGRGPPTTLTSAILSYLKITSVDDLICWAYANSSWARVAALVPVVKACAAAGDTVALDILNKAVEELVGSIRAVVDKLHLSGTDRMSPFPLVLVGGVLENGEGLDLCKSLIHHVSELYPGAKPIRPKVEPAVGAAMLACVQYLEASQKSVTCNGKSNSSQTGKELLASSLPFETSQPLAVRDSE